MSKKKSLISLAVALLSVSALVSCGGRTTPTSEPSGESGSTSEKSSETPKAKKVYVCVYSGGYGTEWIREIAKNYKAKTGIEVVATADSTIIDRLDSILGSKNPDYDIIFSHGINWRSSAAKGQLEVLDDLYNSDVTYDVVDEEESVTTVTKKFSERLTEEANKVARFNGKQGDHFYKVCYTQGAGGFIYNVDMFEENGWDIPTTYEELKTLCQTIVDAEIEVGTREYLVPIAWSGSDRQYYWDYPLYEWWAELAGIEKVNQVKKYLGPTGKYADGYEMYNPNTYYKEFIEAYEKWYNLIALNPAYSQAGAKGAMLLDAQSLFNNGKAAMIPYAQWAKYELVNANDGKDLDFDIAMMKTPKVKVSAPDFNFNVGYDDSIIIPNNCKADAKAAAKDFLRYLSTPEACKTFAEKSNGAFLAFDYKDVDLGELANDTYTKSVYDKLTECTNFNVVSDNLICYANTDKVMPWIENTYYYNIAGAGAYDPATVGTTMYNTAKAGWAGWLRNAGLRD